MVIRGDLDRAGEGVVQFDAALHLVARRGWVNFVPDVWGGESGRGRVEGQVGYLEWRALLVKHGTGVRTQVVKLTRACASPVPSAVEGTSLSE